MPPKTAVSLLFTLLLLPPGAGNPAPRSLLSRRSVDEFLASGGKAWVGKRIHIHIEALVFAKKPKKVRLPGGRLLLSYANDSVPLLVDPRNVYFRRLERKRREKRLKGLVCVKGKVIRPAWDLDGRCFIRVASVKTYGGRLLKDDGKRRSKSS